MIHREALCSKEERRKSPDLNIDRTDGCNSSKLYKNDTPKNKNPFCTS